MEINNYSDLSDFVCAEYDKLGEYFNINKAPESVLHTLDKACIRYIKLYNKPLYKRQKLELRIQQAIHTAPHGLLWRIIHRKLWTQCKLRMAQQQDKPNTQSQSTQTPTLYPTVQRQVEPPREIE